MYLRVFWSLKLALRAFRGTGGYGGSCEAWCMEDLAFSCEMEQMYCGGCPECMYRSLQDDTGSHGERSCSQLLFKYAGTENKLILADNALAVRFGLLKLCLRLFLIHL